MNFEGIYCFDTASVRLAVYPDGPEGARVVAQISEDTLHDGFGTREVGHRLLDVCRNNFQAIEPLVVARYRADPRQPVVTLTFIDFAGQRGASASAATRTDDAVAA
ncbi:hypothetical protein [Variovorax sp. 770b2]|jgi:hypothetical protein|uniref:hypothetical protein n=1 Tax=Variovorax sp. 770b2 TaxID=1566271 RepID=UPI0008E737E6|nr:hypothetical protein [Variovorax sp. 770b2]SFP37042.1 hypothetical protein SAMN03159339_1966 [Variovorax sp. 770b2]